MLPRYLILEWEDKSAVVFAGFIFKGKQRFSGFSNAEPQPACLHPQVIRTNWHFILQSQTHWFLWNTLNITSVAFSIIY